MEILMKEWCECGREAHYRCGEGFQLVVCGLPACSPAGVECGKHRHRQGTMGYPFRGRVTAELIKFSATGDGFLALIFDSVRCWFLNHLATVRQRAQAAYQREIAHYPPPAPLPEVTIIVDGRRFRSKAGKMVEIETTNTGGGDVLGFHR